MKNLKNRNMKPSGSYMVKYCHNNSPDSAPLGCPKNTKVVYIISATILSHSVTTGELPKKISDKSEHPKGSLKLVEILGEITKEIGPNFSKNFDLAITFEPLQFFQFSWVTVILPDLSIYTNDDHIQDHMESGHNGQNGH